MNIKPNLLLMLVPMMMSVTLPALADNTVPLAQKGTVNAVKLNNGTCNKAGGKCEMKRDKFRGAKAFGGHEFRHGRRFHRSILSMLRGEYALTDQQSEKVVALKDQFRSQAQPKIADLLSSKRKMSELMTEPNTDKSQLLSLQNQINSDKDALSNLKLENKLQQLSLLTDAQKTELRHEYLQHAVRRG